MPQWGVTRRNPVSTHEVVEHAFRARNDTVGKIGGGDCGNCLQPCADYCIKVTVPQLRWLRRI